MRSIAPVVGSSPLVQGQQLQSNYQALNGQIDFATQDGVDNLGFVNLFTIANIKCTVLRIGATGTTPPSQVVWTGANTRISHNLDRQPIGWIVVFKDKTCDVIVGTTQADTQYMYLTCTDPTANVTLVMF